VEFLGLLKITVLDTIEFVIVDEQRHLLQIKATLEKALIQEAVLKV
jgi:hypothetical protein